MVIKCNNAVLWYDGKVGVAFRSNSNINGFSGKLQRHENPDCNQTFARMNQIYCVCQTIKFIFIVTEFNDQKSLILQFFLIISNKTRIAIKTHCIKMFDEKFQ